jgi:hypothetical protein
MLFPISASIDASMHDLHLFCAFRFLTLVFATIRILSARFLLGRANLRSIRWLVRGIGGWPEAGQCTGHETGCTAPSSPGRGRGRRPQRWSSARKGRWLRARSTRWSKRRMWRWLRCRWFRGYAGLSSGIPSTGHGGRQVLGRRLG